MKNKNNNEIKVDNNIEKSIKWESIDDLIGLQANQEVLNFEQEDPSETKEDVTPEMDSKQIPNKTNKKITITITALVLIVAVIIGVIALSNEEPSLELGEYREVNIKKDHDFANVIWDHLLVESSLDEYPDKEVETIKKAKGLRIENQAAQYGMTLEQYIVNMNYDIQGYTEYLHEIAEEEYLSRRIAKAIALAEEIEPSTQECEELINKLCGQMGYADIDAAIASGYEEEELQHMVRLNIVKAWFHDNTISIQGDEEEEK